ncbi:MAG: 2-amino-4-hydroxy-6-hydroxymethyldihydropteridine diphosphokinase [Saprospiraceae bacterium]
MENFTQCYLHLGSNIGDRLHHLRAAKAQIAERIGPISQYSKYYETEAWGLTDQADFINQAIGVQTELSPEALLDTVLSIEENLGRERKEKWSARLIDIDIIFYGDQIVQSERLAIPHPHLHQRNFVLIPMLEIAGDWMHPQLLQTIEELYLTSKDPLEVIMLDEL